MVRDRVSHDRDRDVGSHLGHRRVSTAARVRHVDAGPSRCSRSAYATAEVYRSRVGEAEALKARALLAVLIADHEQHSAP
jgi:hypothetical protein